MTRKELGKLVAVMLLGVVVTLAAIYGVSLYKDLRFLHQARMNAEAYAHRPKPAPPVAPVVPKPQ